MGGCSSKPQTTDCNEGMLFHTGLKTSNSSAHQTLESLFNQHGRDGEGLLEDAQTLHELLLHAVESKELPDPENHSAGKTDANLQTRASQPDLSALPCKLNSPASVIAHAAEKNASKCTNVEGPESNEETGAKLASSLVQVSEEIAEKCTPAESFKSNLAENMHDKGAARLENSQSSLAEADEEKSGKVEAARLGLPEETAENCTKGNGFVPNVTEENEEKARKSDNFVPNLAQANPEEEHPPSEFAEGNATEIKPESSNAEPTLASASSECAEHETRDLDEEPKSDSLKIRGPNSSESLNADVSHNIQAPDAVESKEAEVQGLTALAMKGEIGKEVQDAIAMDAEKAHEQEAKAMKYVKDEKALQGEETKEQVTKTIECEEAETAVEGKVNTTMLCVRALEIANDKYLHEGENAEAQIEKGELPKVRFESGGISHQVDGENAMVENTLPEEIKKAVESENVDMHDENVLGGRTAGLQDEKFTEDAETAGVQNERAFGGDAENIQRDEKPAHVEKPANVQDKAKTGVQDDKTRMQTKKAGLEDEETGVQYEKRAEDEKAMAIVSPLPVKAQDEEAMEDVPSSPGNQYFACTSDHTRTKHDPCFEPLTGAEKSIVVMGSGPTLEHASKAKTGELAELGLIEKLDESDEKNFTRKDNVADEVANVGFTEKLAIDQKKLVSDGNTIEAVGLEACSIEAAAAVTGSELAKLCDTFDASDDGQPKAPDSEQMLHIEKHGKLGHDIVGASQHCAADELDDVENAEATNLAESLIQSAIANSGNSKLVQIVGEKGDVDKPASELHEVLDLITSKSVESHTQAHEWQAHNEESHTQVHNESALCSFPESSVHEKLSCLTVVDMEVAKPVLDINSSSLSAADKSCMECVESKPGQRTSGGIIEDANDNGHMGASKQCDEKGRGLKATE